MPLTKRKVFSANRRTSTLLIGSVSPSPCQFVWFKCSQSFSSSLRAAMIAYRNDTCGMTMLANSVWHNVHMTLFGLVLFGQAMVNMYWTLTGPYKGQSQFKRSLLHYFEEGNVSRRTNLRCDHFLSCTAYVRYIYAGRRFQKFGAYSSTNNERPMALLHIPTKHDFRTSFPRFKTPYLSPQ